MTGFYEWLGRVIMLVLAGMITLSIIGAIAAIPSGSIPSQVMTERRERPWPDAEEQQSLPVPAAARPEPRQSGSAASAPVQRTIVGPAPNKPVDPAEWLEAIAYALFALVGLAALGAFLLWRALNQWRRSADAIEALSRRTG